MYGPKSSIIDYTLTTNGLSQFITKWKVLPDESLSDHQYISINFYCSALQSNAEQTNAERVFSIKKADWDLFDLLLTDAALPEAPSTRAEIEPAVISEMHLLQTVCNQCIPTHIKVNKTGCYWWNNKLSELKRNLNWFKRALKIEKNTSPEIRMIFYKAYANAKLLFQNEIKNSKRQNLDNFIAETDGHNIFQRIKAFKPKQQQQVMLQKRDKSLCTDEREMAVARRFLRRLQH
jgi:hypothetical protein